MDDKDAAALFAVAERAERTANQAFGNLVTLAERIRKLEERLARLEETKEDCGEK